MKYDGASTALLLSGNISVDEWQPVEHGRFILQPGLGLALVYRLGSRACVCWSVEKHEPRYVDLLGSSK